MIMFYDVNHIGLYFNYTEEELKYKKDINMITPPKNAFCCNRMKKEYCKNNVLFGANCDLEYEKGIPKDNKFLLKFKNVPNTTYEKCPFCGEIFILRYDKHRFGQFFNARKAMCNGILEKV